MTESLPEYYGRPAEPEQEDTEMPDVEYLMIRIEYEENPDGEGVLATVGFEGQNIDATNEGILLDALNTAALALGHQVVPTDS